MPKRVAIAMFMHETNTFSRLPTDLAAYRARSLLHGADIARHYRGTATEVAAFLDGCARHGWEPVLTTAADATPSGKLTEETYEQIAGRILVDIAAAGPLDAILLCLHGAMVAEHTFDGEGALLERLRAVMGREIPIGVTLDLHANCTDAMAAHADVIVSYRTYPHVDHYEIATECVELIARTLAGEIHPRTLVGRGPQIDGVDKGRTFMPGPMTEGLALARGFMADPGVLSASINAGFPWADIPDAGPTAVLVVDGDSPRYRPMLDRVVRHMWDTRHIQTVQRVTAAEAITVTRAHGGTGGRTGAPVVLADFADNPGGGGYGDTPAMLRAMLEAGFENAAFSALYDPESAAQAHAAGVGATIAMRLGGKVDPAAFGGPIAVSATVLKVFGGEVVLEGPMLRGVTFQMGPSATVRVGGLDIVVASRRFQNFDQVFFKAAGIEPRERRVLGLKSMQHFRAAYAPIAGLIVVVDEGNGCCSERFSQLAYRHVRRPVFPLD